MATYYWVGGSGTWSGSNTGNWASSTGGTGGYGVPTTADDVIFDSNSGTNALITVGGAGVTCKTLTTTSFVGIFRTRNILVYGDTVIIGAQCSFGGDGGAGTAAGLSFQVGLTVNLTIYNQNYMKNITLNGQGMTLNISNPVSGNINVGSITHNYGTLNMGNLNVANTNYSAGPGPLTLNMGSGNWYLYGWNITTPANTTINKETANMIAQNSVGADVNYYFGGKTYNKLTINGTIPFYGFNIMGGGTFSEIVRNIGSNGAPTAIRFDSANATTVGKLNISGNYSNGNYQRTLTTGINNSQTTGISFAGYPADGYGNNIFPNTGSIRVSNEVITYTSWTWDGTNTTLAGVTRGAKGTNAVAHTNTEPLYIPYWMAWTSTISGTRATVNVTTNNGNYYVGLNSINSGNNLGNIVYAGGDNIADYLNIADINLNVTANPITTDSSKFFDFMKR